MTGTYKFNEIVDAVCGMTNIDRSAIMSSFRPAKVVYARRLIVGLARELVGKVFPGFSPTAISFPEIAVAMGASTHSTIWQRYQHWLKIPVAERERLIGETTFRVHKDRYAALGLRERNRNYR